MAINIRPVVAAGAASLVPLAALPTAASAQEVDIVLPRVNEFCRRIPAVEDWLDGLLTVIDGDDSVSGSLAWLEAEIDKAVDNEADERAAVLEHNLAKRTKIRELIILRQGSVADIQDQCDEHFNTDHSEP